MRDPAVDARTDRPDPTRSPPRSASRGKSIPRRRLEPVEFARWVEDRADRLAERWLTEVQSRDGSGTTGREALLGRFFRLLVSILPATLGPYREQVEPIWVQISELFGQVAAQRGLAAGEVIEEFQILRDVLIRLLYAEPPVVGGVRMPLRDILRLNRIVDRGVTHSSVGHTDALFFALFRGSGVPDALDEALAREVEEQLDALEREYRDVMRSLRG
ncbi:MAG: hypothetical protein PVI57_09645 [Gemmatimonadota bacterium]|jgi:hypothetical protein